MRERERKTTRETERATTKRETERERERVERLRESDTKWTERGRTKREKTSTFALFIAFPHSISTNVFVGRDVLTILHRC